MEDDQLERTLAKVGTDSALNREAMRSVASSLADTIRSLESNGVTGILKEMEERSKALRKMFEPLGALMGKAQNVAEAFRSLENSGLTVVIREMEDRNKSLLASLQPHVSAMKHADRLFRESPLFQESQRAAEILKTFDARFRLPVVEEYASLVAASRIARLLNAVGAVLQGPRH